MSARDELFSLIYDAIEWAALEDVNLADHITDAILANGYVKADSEEWGARLGDASGVSRVPSEFEARILEELPRWVAVRRRVGHGPWEVRDDAKAAVDSMTGTDDDALGVTTWTTPPRSSDLSSSPSGRLATGSTTRL